MPKKSQVTPPPGDQYDGLLGGVVELLGESRQNSVRVVNSIMTATYWEIGRRIVEFEQGGEERAEYGTDLLKRLGKDLTAKLGRGFGWRNLYSMRGFFLAYPSILQTLSAKLQTPENKGLTANSGEPAASDLPLTEVAPPTTAMPGRDRLENRGVLSRRRGANAHVPKLCRRALDERRRESTSWNYPLCCQRRCRRSLLARWSTQQGDGRRVPIGFARREDTD